MSSTLLSVLLMVLPMISSEDIKSLCEDPYIHSADWLPNNTYRVYRDDYYWELIGLPDRRAKVKGPFKAWYPFMAPLTRDSAVQTIVGGQNPWTYKFKGTKYWAWNKDGRSMEGEQKDGWLWKDAPPAGFSAAYNDGGMGGNNYPMLVGFSGIQVYYFNTLTKNFRRVGPVGGARGGMFNESFPSDLSAAFAFRSSEPGVKYYVYLFKAKRHCFRPVVGEKECKEWRDNTELFGCNDSPIDTTKQETDPSSGGEAKGVPKVPEPDEPDQAGGETNESPKGNKGNEGNKGNKADHPGAQNFILYLFALILYSQIFLY